MDINLQPGGVHRTRSGVLIATYQVRVYTPVINFREIVAAIATDMLRIGYHGDNQGPLRTDFMDVEVESPDRYMVRRTGFHPYPTIPGLLDQVMQDVNQSGKIEWDWAGGNVIYTVYYFRNRNQAMRRPRRWYQMGDQEFQLAQMERQAALRRNLGERDEIEAELELQREHEAVGNDWGLYDDDEWDERDERMLRMHQNEDAVQNVFGVQEDDNPVEPPAVEQEPPRRRARRQQQPPAIRAPALRPRNRHRMTTRSKAQGRGRIRGGGVWKRPIDMADILAKKALIEVPGSGIQELCLMYALLHATEYGVREEEDGKISLRVWERVMENSNDRLELSDIIEACVFLQIPTQGPLTEDDVCEKYAAMYGVNITVLDRSLGSEPVRRYLSMGEYNKPVKKFIYIYLVDNHYHAVNKVHRLYGDLSPMDFCHFCNKHYKNMKQAHHKRCNQRGPRELCDSFLEGTYLVNTSFQRKPRQHFARPWDKEKGTLHYCSQCDRYLDKETRDNTMCYDEIPHLDLEIAANQCRTCMEIIPKDDQFDHVCYIPHPKKLKVGELDSYVVYDVESMVDEQGIHTVNLVVMKELAEGANFMIFQTIEDFCEEIFGNDRYKNKTFIAHNGGKYDHQFVMRWCEKRFKIKKVTAGESINNLLELTCEGRRFIDSYKHITIGLAKFAQTYGLKDSKGHFPHAFNRVDHQTYSGAMPSIEWYEIDNIRGTTQAEIDKAKQEFMKWYDEEKMNYIPHTTRPWVLRQVLEDYCVLDVEVLAQGVIRHREIFMTLHEHLDEHTTWRPSPIDPWQYTTLPQQLKNLWLNGLPDSVKVANIPVRRRPDWKHEGVLLSLWAEKEKHLEPIRSLYSTLYEYELAEMGFVVDLYGRCRRTGALWAVKYLDCDYWGCPDCYSGEESVSRQHGQLHSKMRITVQTAKAACEFMNTKHLFVWGCQYENQLEAVIRHEPWFDMDLPCLMLDREMFYGGRVEVFAPLCDLRRQGVARHVAKDYIGVMPDTPEADVPLEIHMGDVCSLYPYVIANLPLPSKHPKIRLYPRWGGVMTGDELDIQEKIENRTYRGIVRCRIRPNTSDRIGLLPQKSNDRLMFTVEPQVGCWTHDELYLAMDNGYVVEQVYETHEFAEEDMSVTLFRSYVEFFLRMKIEAEGWPKENMTSEEQEEYCNEWYVNNGNMARPRPRYIRKNPGLRYIAKICLNSLWGKLCQNDARHHFGYVSAYEEVYDLLNNPIVVPGTVQLRYINDDRLEYRCCLNTDGVHRSSAYNIYIASYVTAHARNVLHRGIQHVMQTGGLPLYCDTDSIVYLSIGGRGELPYKNGLGCWSRETAEDNPGILFVGLSPKCYALQTVNGKVKLKSKGMTIDGKNCGIINADTFRRLVLQEIYRVPLEIREQVRAPVFQIRISSKDETYGQLISLREIEKALRPVYTKRILHTSELTPYNEEEWAQEHGIEDPSSCIVLGDLGYAETYPNGYLYLDGISSYTIANRIYSQQTVL